MADVDSLPVDLRPDVVLRRARSDDVAPIVALLTDDPLGATRESADLAPYTRAFERIAGDPDELLLVVESDGAVVGTMQLSLFVGLGRRGAVRMQIEGVRVVDRLRSRGIGGDMIAWAVAEARRRDCALVQLMSDRSRTDAHRFYDRLGFTASHVGFKLLLEPAGG